MRITEYEEFENGDKVRLITDWYERNGFKHKKGDVFIVEYQDNLEDVYTNKGWFNIKELELVED